MASYAMAGAYMLTFVINFAIPAMSPRLYLHSEYTVELKVCAKQRRQLASAGVWPGCWIATLATPSRVTRGTVARLLASNVHRPPNSLYKAEL